MSQPVWQTPAGSLGVIPESVFYQQTLSATVAPLISGVTVTGTSGVNNAITCNSTSGVVIGQVVTFTGTAFGGIGENTSYFVLSVLSATTFSITTTAGSSTPVALTTGTGIMTASFAQPVFYRLVAGQVPKGVQIASNGLVTGVPQAVATVQGVPIEVAEDVTSKFSVRAFTVASSGAVDRIADRTFTLTVTGNDVPRFITPPGAFADNNTASFVASIANQTMSVTSIISGEIVLGMSLRGPGVSVGTTVIGYINANGGTGLYRISIPQNTTSVPVTGVVGVYFDGDQVILQIEYTASDPGEVPLVRLVSGSLPGGLSLSDTGLISGYIAPAPNVLNPPGYDVQANDTVPYDFIVDSISKNYQFTLEVTDGKSSDLRTFTIYVFSRDDLSADTTIITADTTYVTADQTSERAPFLLNAEPSDLGRVRGDNYFAYRFVGEDYDTDLLEYRITVNQGIGLPPGLTLDPYSGWYYGYIPDQGGTEVTYSFNIQVRNRSMVATSTTSGTNIITVDGATRDDIYVGVGVVFEGTGFGGIVPETVYYVAAIPSDTTLQISATLGGPVLTLTSATGRLLAVSDAISKSQLYPFVLTITGVVNSEVTWLTDSDLGFIENGSISLLRVEAVSAGGAELFYRLRSGAFNELPQGLQLLPSGDIAGRVTFNTFAIDLGATTFDVSQSTQSGLEITTFDSTFTFTVNAFAEDTQQILYKVSDVIIENGGTGYSSGLVVTFNTPVGAVAVQATATATVVSGSIVAINITESGNGYLAPAEITLTGAGSGAVLRVIMEATGSRDAISVFKTFTVRVIRRYNLPFQNLYVLAMPPQEDRDLIRSLLTDQRIFVPEYIFRPEDPYFGLSTGVKYQHAFGLAPDTYATYVESLYLNHYWKNLVLGSIQTAQAVDANDQVIYEVVYSQIIDDLVNAQGQSVNKIVNLPYSIIDPADGSTVINQVYPNSLINMRDQVIDTVGQISTELPLWMTSKQANGRVLGFTPAWVICYTKPGRAAQIAYYLSLYFGVQLNVIDFKVDRYELEGEATRNWDAENQSWTPTPNLTTFDRVDTAGFTDLGIVNACTDLAFADVNGKTIQSINELGGLDGQTWIAQAGQTPPVGTQVTIRNGSRIVFVKQENYNGPPGSRYLLLDDAWSNYIQPFDQTGFDSGDITGQSGSFDFGPLIFGGTTQACTATNAATDLITCESTLNMQSGDKIWFTGVTFGGINEVGPGGITQVYYVLNVDSLICTATDAASSRITTSNTANLSLGDEIWFSGTAIGGLTTVSVDGLARPYYIVDIPNSTQIQISTTPGGAAVTLATESGGSMKMNLGRFSVTLTPTGTTAVALTTDSGSMTVNYGNDRMSIWTVNIVPGANPNVDDIIQLTQVVQTVTNDYVTSSQGQRYNTGTLLYRPGTPQQSLIRVNWQPLITATTIISAETIFDQGSLQFVEPVDMFDPTDRFDKYLVFPKSNILV